MRTDFDRVLQTIKPGSRFTYFRGNLGQYRKFTPSPDADAAWRAYEAGRCLLVQKRIDHRSCEYIAIKL